jgi:hypothetical protein
MSVNNNQFKWLEGYMAGLDDALKIMQAGGLEYAKDKLHPEAQRILEMGETGFQEQKTPRKRRFKLMK